MKVINAQNLMRQKGAATLVVVMVLFLVMALLAAYANRSMLFEQRIAASYFRASLAQEAAEGAVEWTLAQLNGAAVDDTCTPVASGGRRFADRYLQINAADRSIVPTGAVDCARDVANEGWACRCPAAGAAHTSSTPITSTQPTPSFNVTLARWSQSGTLKLRVTGCTDSVVDTCAGVVNKALSQSMVAQSQITALIGLVSAVRNPPAVPLVVKGQLASSDFGLGLHNTDARSGGGLAMIGGAWDSRDKSRLESIPGTPLSQTLMQPDDKLNDATVDVFKMFMGTSVAAYPHHPAARTIVCDGDCSSALEDAYKAGKRILWIDGPMNINSSKIFGSIGDPLLVIATGAVTLSSAFEFNGMLVSIGNLHWTQSTGAPRINGILLVGGAMETTGRVDIVYQQAVADQLRNRMGSYVRVLGGWIDTDSL